MLVVFPLCLTQHILSMIWTLCAFFPKQTQEMSLESGHFHHSQLPSCSWLGELPMVIEGNVLVQLLPSTALGSWQLLVQEFNAWQTVGSKMSCSRLDFQLHFVLFYLRHLPPVQLPVSELFTVSNKLLWGQGDYHKSSISRIPNHLNIFGFCLLSGATDVAWLMSLILTRSHIIYTYSSFTFKCPCS